MILTNRTVAIIAEELHTALKRETDDIIAIGGLLTEAKAQVKHGEWLPWLKREFSMSERSAQNYMKAAEFADKNEIVADLKLSPLALYLLSGDSYSEDEYGRREAIDAVVKVASEERVGYDRAKEIIDRTCARKKARDEAIAEAMADDKEQAKHDAAENGEWRADLEHEWSQKWDWGDEREAEFEADWNAREEAVAPALQPDFEVTATKKVLEQDPQPMKPRSAVNSKEEGLIDFSARVRDLIRRTAKQKVRRFAATSVPADDLTKLAKFLADLAILKKADASKPDADARLDGKGSVSLEQSDEERKAHDAALDATDDLAA